MQGIDNHQLTNMSIVTAAGAVNTQRGPVALIMNQCCGNLENAHQWVELATFPWKNGDISQQ